MPSKRVTRKSKTSKSKTRKSKRRSGGGWFTRNTPSYSYRNNAGVNKEQQFQNAMRRINAGKVRRIQACKDQCVERCNVS